METRVSLVLKLLIYNEFGKSVLLIGPTYEVIINCFYKITNKSFILLKKVIVYET